MSPSWLEPRGAAALLTMRKSRMTVRLRATDAAALISHDPYP